MSWLDERIAQSTELRARKYKIETARGPLFEAVWTEMCRIVDEAKGKGFSLNAVGGSAERMIQSFTPPKQAEQRLHIKLSPDGTKITSSEAAGKSNTFTFSLDQNGEACLSKGETLFTAVEAAQEILDHFLFPELDTANQRFRQL